jgi:hypothetical protein
MAKSQVGARIPDEVLELARARAKDRGLSIGDYLAQLVMDDVDGLRARGVEAARRFLDEHQTLFDEAEDAEQPATGARAA